MSAANFLEGKVLDHVFGIAEYTQPTLYVGLSRADPGEDGSGLDEQDSTDYVRIACAAWTRAGSVISNTNDIEFPEAEESWGEITHGCIFDSVTGSNLLISFALDSPETVGIGQVVRFNAGELDITCD